MNLLNVLHFRVLLFHVLQFGPSLYHVVHFQSTLAADVRCRLWSVAGSAVSSLLRPCLNRGEFVAENRDRGLCGAVLYAAHFQCDCFCVHWIHISALRGSPRAGLTRRRSYDVLSYSPSVCTRGRADLACSYRQDQITYRSTVFQSQALLRLSTVPISPGPCRNQPDPFRVGVSGIYVNLPWNLA